MNALTRRESLLITEARPSSRRDFGLLWYWRAIYHRKWAILLIVALVGVFAAMYAVTLPPVFRATTTVMVLEARKKVVSNEELLDATAGTSRDFYATQFEVMKSRDFAERVVRTLNLTSHPAYDPRSPTDRWYAQWLPDESVAPA